MQCCNRSSHNKRKFNNVAFDDRRTTHALDSQLYTENGDGILQLAETLAARIPGPSDVGEGFHGLLRTLEIHVLGDETDEVDDTLLTLRAMRLSDAKR